ncbi:MAG TPA: hypothetical protein VEB66_08075 [Opitutaceae bacterium]|nr:hypothetical protein [Opitutaceae bacterium]
MDKKSLLLGCGIALAICLLVVAGFIGFLFYIAVDPPDITAVVSAPAEVKVGEAFDLEVVVTNRRAKGAMALSDIDVGESYLAGFKLASVEPTPKSSMHVPIDESRSFTFSVGIPAGESRTFVFRLQAETAGLHAGDVDVCEGLRFLTKSAQTRVLE